MLARVLSHGMCGSKRSWLRDSLGKSEALARPISSAFHGIARRDLEIAAAEGKSVLIELISSVHANDVNPRL